MTTTKPTSSSAATVAAGVFDIGIDDRVPIATSIGLGVQNILGMAGLLIFPALIGSAFHMSTSDTAYLYGITFMTSGLVVILQSVFLLRLPIVQGPYAGSLAALLAVGHESGLGAAFGSMVVAGAIWCVLALPIRKLSLIGRLGRFLRDPIIPGIIVMILATQLTSTALPNWLGAPTSPGFPGMNLISGAIAAALVVALTVLPRRTRWGTMLRRGAVLVAIVVGTIVYAVFEPTTFGEIGKHATITVPRLFPFGFGVHAELVLIFFITLLPAVAESIATYDIVAGWGGHELTAYRVSQGVFGEVLGSTVGSVFGGMSTLAYPDNIGLLRVTRVGSRYVTLTTGVILLVLGGVGPFDGLLQAVPLPVLAAAGTVLFGVLFASSIEVLSHAEWNQENMMIAGVPFITAIGGLFIPAVTLKAMPMTVQLVLGQPLILGTLLLILMKAAFALRRTHRAGDVS
ncbi:uracil-xanthine permease family protein [Amycolatopsis acidiphila]|uniref:Xanthine/uracil permease n=1 Tax=Amycolatopsis acidiphila TaxID=715473 RepID=A0A558A643_9PSEU|nr:solute carrier family 23 protein [Amycolatopsis acidiphila]TVT19744.1 hypothetical protein FNH06_22990 [Amycolatopsis acidiphila]GHG57299.1 uric acid permease [Amycolatopsis acidiphila]